MDGRAAGGGGRRGGGCGTTPQPWETPLGGLGTPTALWSLLKPPPPMELWDPPWSLMIPFSPPMEPYDPPMEPCDPFLPPHGAL